jgi:hypothetical protein
MAWGVMGNIADSTSQSGYARPRVVGISEPPDSRYRTLQNPRRTNPTRLAEDAPNEPKGEPGGKGAERTTGEELRDGRVRLGGLARRKRFDGPSCRCGFSGPSLGVAPPVGQAFQPGVRLETLTFAQAFAVCTQHSSVTRPGSAGLGGRASINSRRLPNGSRSSNRS